MPDVRPYVLLVGEDADKWAVHDESGRLERVACGAGRGDALGLCRHECRRAPEVCLPQSVGQGHRRVPLQKVDVPHRAVIELTAIVWHVLEDVDRRQLIEDGGVLTLSLVIVRTRLAVDEGDQALARTSRSDEWRGLIDVVRTAIRERDVAESWREGDVLDCGGGGGWGGERH